MRSQLDTNLKEAIKSLCTWAQKTEEVLVVIFRGASPLPPPEGKRQKPHAFVAGADVSEFVGKDSTTIRKKQEVADNDVDYILDDFVPLFQLELKDDLGKFY